MPKTKKEKVEKEQINDVTVIKNNKKEDKKDQKAAFIERLGALIVDFLLISIVISLITYPFTNNTNYEKLQKEMEETTKSYSTGKIDAKTYLSRAEDINYDISRESGLSSVISILIFSLYFIIFQYKNDGQTIGKKLLKIKIEKTNDTELTINDIMFRSLIVNFILYDIVALCFTLFAGKDIYFYGILTFELIQYAILLISSIMILTRKDKRGLHDIITNTQVIKERGRSI